MAYSSIATCLSLEECAALLQINPAHYNQATAAPTAYTLCSGACQDIWAEEAWQSPSGFSRTSMARAILRAETEIGRYMGMPVLPRQTSKVIRLATPMDPYGGVHVYLGSFLPEWSPYLPVVVEEGVVPSVDDVDGDDFFETATFSVDVGDLTSADSFVAYAGGHFGEIAYQIRPLHNVAVTNDILTFDLYRWQMIERSYFLRPNLVVVDMLDESAYVGSVDVGVMQADLTGVQATFIYEESDITCGDPDCLGCSGEVVHGIWEENKDHAGTVRVWPAEQDEETGLWSRIERESCGCNRAPSAIQVFYYLPPYGTANPLNELSDELKWAVSLLAGARTQYGKCDCECSGSQWMRELQVDLAQVSGAGRYTTQAQLDCPFGTLRGEKMAYDALRNLMGSSARLSHGSY